LFCFAGESPTVVNCDKKCSLTKKVDKPKFDVSVDSDDESEESEEDEDWDETDRAVVDDEDFHEKMKVTILSKNLLILAPHTNMLFSP
jgi:hypothetical protein